MRVPEECTAHAKDKEKSQTRAKRKLHSWFAEKLDAELQEWRDSIVDDVRMYPAIIRGRTERRKVQEGGVN